MHLEEFELASASGKGWHIASGLGCRQAGEGDDGSAGVTAIRGAGSMRGGKGDDDVPLMMDARGEEGVLGWGAQG